MAARILHALTVANGRSARLTEGLIAFVWTTSPDGPRIYTMTAAGAHAEEIPGQVMGNDQPCWK